MPKQLVDLLRAGFMRAGDVVFFTFKKHTFHGVITENGFIHRTTHHNESIFGSTCFETLTRWTETCLQERLQEYNTRYSAWRRVKHLEKNLTLETLYNKLQKKKLLEQRHIHGARLEQLVRLQQLESCELKTQLQDAHQALDQWHDWWRNHRGNTPPPVPEIVVEASVPPPMAAANVETVEAPAEKRTSIWYPPGVLDTSAVMHLEPRAVAAYTHAFFT